MNALTILTAALAFGAVGDNTAKDDTTGSIEGQVIFEGKKPAPKPDISITNQEQTKGCHEHGEMTLKDNTLLIDDKGGVANVVMTIKAKGVEPNIPKEAIVVDQKGCRFDPHVVVVPQGAKVKFANSDGTTHNVHTFPKKNKPENKNVAGGSSMEQVLDKSETILVKCDVHPWMKGYVVVTDATHFAKSNADGSFKIEGLPAGDYKVSWWHEELGKGKTEKVTVTAGAEAALKVEVGAKAKKKGGRRRR